MSAMSGRETILWVALRPQIARFLSGPKWRRKNPANLALESKQNESFLRRKLNDEGSRMEITFEKIWSGERFSGALTSSPKFWPRFFRFLLFQNQTNSNDLLRCDGLYHQTALLQSKISTSSGFLRADDPG